MSKIEKVIFRVDYNKYIGIGHIKRCLNLSHLFLRRKTKVIFVIKKFSKNFKIKIPKKIKIYYINQKFSPIKESKKLSSILKKENANILIVDLDYNYKNSKKILSQKLQFLNFDRYKVVIWDNLYNLDYKFTAVYRPYPKFINLIKISKNLKKISGFDYFYYPDKFLQKNSKNTIKKILISLGGTNNSGLIKYLLLRISKKYKFRINILIFNNEEKKIIKEFIERKKYQNFKIVYRANKINNFLKISDLAIISGGMTKYETALSKVPSIIINLNKGQKIINKNISPLNFGVMINHKKNFDDKFFEIINLKTRKKIINNLEKLRQQYSEEKLFHQFERLLK